MTRKRILAIIAVIVVTALVILSITRGPGALDVETAVVHRDTVRVTIDEEGVTRARDRYTIGAPVTGRLTRLSMSEGDAVAEGQIMAQIYPAPEDPRVAAANRARVTAAEAMRAQAAAQVAEITGQHEQAVREAERVRKLAAAGALSAEAVEQADLAAKTTERRLQAAQSAVAAADAEIDAARAQLIGADQAGGQGLIAVRAPVAGRVLRILEKSERVVMAGTPLIELADARGLEVVVDVMSEDAVRIQPGDPMLITDWGGDDTINGTVRLVEPDAFTHVSALGVEEQRVNIVGDLQHAPHSLGTGYRIQARIVTWQGDDVLMVPSSALFRSGPAWQVFTLVDGRARLRDIEIGHRGHESAEVLAGLDVGDTVILYPSDQIADGVRVRSN